MTTSTLPADTAAPPVDTAAPSVYTAAHSGRGIGGDVTRGPADRSRMLALVAPLLLFTHGILSWVDGIGAGDPARTGGSVLAVVAGGTLVLAVAGFAALASALASRSQRPELATPVTMLGAFGAGAAAAVWLGRAAGWLVDPLPTALTSGGAVLTGLALAFTLLAQTVEGRMPSGSLALSGARGSRAGPPPGPGAPRRTPPAHRARPADATAGRVPAGWLSPASARVGCAWGRAHGCAAPRRQIGRTGRIGQVLRRARRALLTKDGECAARSAATDHSPPTE